MPWIVFATAPKDGWTFKNGHFPRTVHYKKDAKELADEAKGQDGTNVHFVNENEVKLTKLNTHFVVRCEKHNLC